MAAVLGPTAGYEGWETTEKLVDAADTPNAPKKPKTPHVTKKPTANAPATPQAGNQRAPRQPKTRLITAQRAATMSPKQFATRYRQELNKARNGDTTARDNIATMREAGINAGILTPDGKRLNTHTNKKNAAKEATKANKDRETVNKQRKVDGKHTLNQWDTTNKETRKKQAETRKAISEYRAMDTNELKAKREQLMQDVVTWEAQAEGNPDLYDYAGAGKRELYRMDAALLANAGYDPFDETNTPDWTLTENLDALPDSDLKQLENNTELPGWTRDLISEELEAREPWRDGGILQTMLKEATVTEIMATQAKYTDTGLTKEQVRQAAANAYNHRYAYEADNFDNDYAEWVKQLTGKDMGTQFATMNPLAQRTGEQNNAVNKLGFIPTRANFARIKRNEPVNTYTGHKRAHKLGTIENDQYTTGLENLIGTYRDTITPEERAELEHATNEKLLAERDMLVTALKQWGNPPQFADLEDEFEHHQALHRALAVDNELHARHETAKIEGAEEPEQNPFHTDPPTYNTAADPAEWDEYQDALMYQADLDELRNMEWEQLEEITNRNEEGKEQYTSLAFDEMQRRDPFIEGGELDSQLPYSGIRELTATYKKFRPDQDITPELKDELKDKAALAGNDRFADRQVAYNAYTDWLDSVMIAPDSDGTVRDWREYGATGEYRDAAGNRRETKTRFDDAIRNNMTAAHLSEETAVFIAENIGFLPTFTNWRRKQRGETPPTFSSSAEFRRELGHMGGTAPRRTTAEVQLDREIKEQTRGLKGQEKRAKEYELRHGKKPGQPDATTTEPDPKKPATNDTKKSKQLPTPAPTAETAKTPPADMEQAQDRHKTNADTRIAHANSIKQDNEKVLPNGELQRGETIIYQNPDGTYSVKPYTLIGGGKRRAPRGNGKHAETIEQAREIADKLNTPPQDTKPAPITKTAEKDPNVIEAMTNTQTGRISRKTDLTKFKDEQLANTARALRAEKPDTPAAKRDRDNAVRHIEKERGRRINAMLDEQRAKDEAQKPQEQRDLEARERTQKQQRDKENQERLAKAQRLAPITKKLRDGEPLDQVSDADLKEFRETWDGQAEPDFDSLAPEQRKEAKAVYATVGKRLAEEEKRRATKQEEQSQQTGANSQAQPSPDATNKKPAPHKKGTPFTEKHLEPGETLTEDGKTIKRGAYRIAQIGEDKYAIFNSFGTSRGTRPAAKSLAAMRKDVKRWEEADKRDGLKFLKENPDHELNTTTTEERLDYLANNGKNTPEAAAARYLLNEVRNGRAPWETKDADKPEPKKDTAKPEPKKETGKATYRPSDGDNLPAIGHTDNVTAQNGYVTRPDGSQVRGDYGTVRIDPHPTHKNRYDPDGRMAKITTDGKHLIVGKDENDLERLLEEYDDNTGEVATLLKDNNATPEVDLKLTNWERNGKTRTYVNKWHKQAGLEIHRYNTGNISAAYVDGEKIANRRARMADGSVWVDNNTGELHIDAGEDTVLPAATIAERLIPELEKQLGRKVTYKPRNTDMPVLDGHTGLKGEKEPTTPTPSITEWEHPKTGEKRYYLNNWDELTNEKKNKIMGRKTTASKVWFDKDGNIHSRNTGGWDNEQESLNKLQAIYSEHTGTTPTRKVTVNAQKAVVAPFTPNKGRDKGKTRYYINNLEQIARNQDSPSMLQIASQSRAWLDEDGILYIVEKKYSGERYLLGGASEWHLSKLKEAVYEAVDNGTVDKDGNKVTKPGTAPKPKGKPKPDTKEPVPPAKKQEGNKDRRKRADIAAGREPEPQPQVWNGTTGLTSGADPQPNGITTHHNIEEGTPPQKNK